MRKPRLFVLPVLAAALAGPGCTGTIIKEGAGVALGATGTYMPIRALAADKADKPLGAYQRFELGAITDGIGGKAPGEFLSYLPQAFEEELKSAKIANAPTGKAIVIRGTIVHYESASTLGFALGPLEEVIVLTELVDKETGAVLGQANCIGRTTERVNTGVKKKAEGLAKAFVKWIESAYPDELKQKKKK